MELVALAEKGHEPRKSTFQVTQLVSKKVSVIGFDMLLCACAEALV